MANLFLPQLITWFRLDEHVKRLKGHVDALENNSGGDFIPLTGTTEGNPVTGDIEFSELVNIKNNNGDYYRNIRFDDEQSINLQSGNADDGSVSDIRVKASGIELQKSDGLGNFGYFTLSESIAKYHSNNALARGFTGDQDFTANITDLDYTQKKYVDERVTISKPYKTFTCKVNQINPGEELGVVVFENNFNPITTWQRLSEGLYRLNLSPDGEAVDFDKLYVPNASETWIPFNSEFGGFAGQYQIQVPGGEPAVYLRVINTSNTYTDLADIGGFSGGEYLHLPEIREYF